MRQNANPHYAVPELVDVDFTTNVQSNGQEPALKYSLPELGSPFPLTRSGFAINQPFFARKWGLNRLAFFDEASGHFYCYNPSRGLFEELRDNEIRRFITEDLYAEARFQQVTNVGAKISISCQRSIIDLIKSDEHCCKKDYFTWDPSADPVIHTANAMVCIHKDSIETKEFSPAFKSRNQIPIKYNPTAKAPKLLKAFLEEVLDKDDIEMLQRYCGLILIGGNRAQKILFLLGKAGVGKGTIVRLIVRVLGKENVEQLRVDKLAGRFETSRLVGKLLLNVVEAPEDFFSRPGAETVKALCGHDAMDAESKGSNESIDFEGDFPVVVSSNEQLRVRLAGDEDAWMRRIAIIDFSKSRDPDAKIIENYEEVLIREEGEEILAWMIEGAKRHWKELKQGKGFTLTPVQKNRVESLIARSKSVELFVTTRISPNKGENVTVDELFNAYIAFCSTKKWSPAKQQHFETTSRLLIFEHFGMNLSHDIERNGKNSKRGYRALQLAGNPLSDLIDDET